eukprot:458548_1
MFSFFTNNNNETFHSAHPKLKILNNRSTLKRRNDNDSDYAFYIGYGSKKINTNSNHKYEWTLKLENGSNGYYIGIASNRSVNADYKNIAYAYDTRHGHRYNYGKITCCEGTSIMTGTVRMILDCPNKTISFLVKNHIYKINIQNGIYYLAIAVFCSSISIIDFKCHEQSLEHKQNEQNQQISEQNKKDNKSIKVENNGFEQQIISLQKKLNEYDTANKRQQKIISSLRSNKDENELLKKENIRLKQEIQRIKKDKNEEFARSQRQIIHLQEECKKLKIENYKLKRKHMEPSNYLNWNCD